MKVILILCSIAQLLLEASAHSQHVFRQADIPDETLISSVLSSIEDPADALISLFPNLAIELSEPRFLEVLSVEGSSNGWYTEADKLRLRRNGTGFIDWTGRRLDSEPVPPNLPQIEHQKQVQAVLPHLSTVRMSEFLDKFTGFYNRLYTSETGVESQRWLFDQILETVRKAPSSCRLSVEQVPHAFPQNSIIARFSPPGPKNVSQPVTIIGAHPDSVNYYFPLLNAPGADDDASGTASALEAFAALVTIGFEPEHGPVEFHWWAGEEAGLLGSSDVAEDYRRRGINVTAILNLDETAFVKANSTPAINLVEVGATPELLQWVHKLAEEYVDIGVKRSGMIGRGLDHQAWTRHGFPAVSAVEGDQAEGGWLPFPHTVLDRTAISPDVGEYSLEHMRQFSKLAVAFAIEQGGMTNHNWR